MKFLFDLLPVMAFFITYKLTSHGAESSCHISSSLPLIQEPILIATIAAILVTCLQVAWLLIRKHKIEKMLWVSLGLIVVFGSATLYFRDPIFIQWKPTILYWCMAAFLALSAFFLEKSPIRQAMEAQITLPDEIWKKLTWAWIVFFILAGFTNLLAMHMLSCNGWVNFKLYGLMGFMFIFAIAQSLYLSRFMEND